MSRTSARGVADALTSAGHGVTVLELDASLPEALRRASCDVVFPTTHGPVGEDGCLQGMLEVMGLPYVGSAVLARALGMSKPHAKALFRAAGLPVAPDVVVYAGEDLVERASAVRRALGLSVVVKPGNGGSAIGVTRINDAHDARALVTALESALVLDSTVLVEAFQVGGEVTCGVLEDAAGAPRALPPTLILPRAADWYDFRSRYAAKGSVHRCPAPFAPRLLQRIQRVAEDAHRALGARDLSRADFVVRDDGANDAVMLLEVNTLPGMTPTSLFPEAAAIAGVPFPELCDTLVRRAYTRPPRPSPDVMPMPEPRSDP